MKAWNKNLKPWKNLIRGLHWLSGNTDNLWQGQHRFRDNTDLLVTRLDIKPLIIWTALFWLACPVILTSKKAGISGLSSDANVIFAIKLLWPVQLCYQELSSYANRIFFSKIHNKKEKDFKVLTDCKKLKYCRKEIRW